jgi:WD40 repeat protein
VSFTAVLARLQKLDNPYPGLRPFETDEAHLFFGRDQQIAEVVGRLERNRLLAVLGVSGSGKSSLVRAGMIPALERGSVTNPGRQWRIVVTRPAGAPFESLAAALAANQLDPAGLRDSSLGLVQIARQLSADERLLVIVDQFEEIFRYKDIVRATSSARRDLSAAAADAADFAQLLLSAGRAYPPVYVVLTMRSDYLGDCAEFRDLPEALNDSQYLLPRMTREQRKEAIERPLGRVEMAPTLVQRVLNDAGDEPDQLPVLQHALMRTWSHWRRTDPDRTRRIDLSDYRAIGGFSDALNQHADELLAGVDRDLAAIIFKRLTARGRGRRERRDPAMLSELWALCGAETAAAQEQVTAIVEHFRRGEATFLWPRGGGLEPGTYVDITHESLIRQWATMRDVWLPEEERSAKIFLTLAERARLWESGRAELLMGADLTGALEWNRQRNQSAAWAEHYADGSELARVGLFVDASERRQRDVAVSRTRERRRRLLMRTAAIVAVVAGLAVFTFYRQSMETVRKIELQSRILSARAVTDGLVRALLLNELGAASTKDQLAIYQEAATSTIPFSVRRRAGNAEVKGLGFVGTDRVAAMYADGTLTSWRRDGRDDPSARALIRFPPRVASSREPWLKAVAFSPDGQWIALGLCTSEVRLIRLAGPAGPPYVVPADAACGAGRSPVTALAFSRDGRQLAAGYASSTTNVWSLDAISEGPPKGAPIVLDGKQVGSIASLDFDPTGASVATGSNDGSCRIWLQASPDRPVRDFRLEHGDVVTSATFSPDGTWLLCGYATGAARMWRTSATDAAGAVDLRGHVGAVTAVAFSRTHAVVTASDRTVRVWMFASNPQCVGPAPPLTTIGVSRVLTHDAMVAGIAFSADDESIATSAQDGTVRTWSAEQQEPRILGLHHARVEDVVFDRDGRRVASASDDRTAQIWSVSRSTPTVCLEGHGDWVRSVAFSPADARTVVTASEDRTMRIWDSQTPGRSQTAIERDRLFSAAFDPAGRRIVTAAVDGSARVWTLAALRRGGWQEGLSSLDRPIGLQLPNRTWALSAAFNVDGSKVVTGARDGGVGLWPSNRAADRPEREFRGSDEPVFSTAFSPDGTRIAAGSGGGVARIWRLDESGDPIELRHLDDVKKVVFDANGDLLTASADGTARLWNKDGRPILALEHGAGTQVTAAAFDPGGARVATGTNDGVIRLWRVTFEDLREFLAGATTACLTPTMRMQYLGESEHDAERAHARCESRYGRSVSTAVH